MREKIYIIVVIAWAFALSAFCFHEYLRTKIFTNITCAHPVETTALLYWRGVGDYCEWHVDYGDRIAIESKWDNCRRYEQGVTYPYVITNHSCEHLEKNLPIPTKQELADYLAPLGYPY